jgi:hypothetical protein
MDKKRKPLSKAELSAMRTQKCKSKIASKQKEELELQSNIHNLSLALQSKAAKHKKIKEDKISNRVKEDRLQTHHQRYKRDQSLRPSDRGNDVRLYTKMDLNIWEYPDMREWFNSAAPADIEDRMAYKLRPHETGYTIRI